MLRSLGVAVDGDGYGLEGALDFGGTGTSSHAVDGAWLERLAQGDRDALRALYRRHHVAVRAFAARLLGDDHAAEDLVHDVFVALPRAIKGFRAEASFEGYLIGIAANLARRHLRSSKRRRALLQRVAGEPPREVVRPDQAAADAELALRLMHALDQLPDRQRVAFVLCQIEDRDASEVGAILGVPASTVRARVRAARSRLQSMQHFRDTEPSV